jgi:hypothetical protein
VHVLHSVVREDSGIESFGAYPEGRAIHHHDSFVVLFIMLTIEVKRCRIAAVRVIARAA